MFGKDISIIPLGVIEKLDSHHWPGNIRKLENIIERAVITSPGKKLEIIGLDVKRIKKKIKKDKILPFQDNQRVHILRALELTNWKKSGPNGTAQILGMNSRTLDSKIRKLGIKRESTI